MASQLLIKGHPINVAALPDAQLHIFIFCSSARTLIDSVPLESIEVSILYSSGPAVEIVGSGEGVVDNPRSKKSRVRRFSPRAAENSRRK